MGTRHYRQIQFIAITSVILTILLFYCGPLLDHHFVERQPFHTHIYFGPRLLEHIHPYEVPHVHNHSHPAANSASDASSQDSVPAGLIMYMAVNDGLVLGLSMFAIDLIPAAFAPLDREDSRLAFRLLAEDRLFQDAFIPPPEKPPRV